LAVAGVRRLDAVSSPGPQDLAPAIAGDLDPVLDDLIAACAALSDRITGATHSPTPDLAGIDESLSAGIERLRSTHLTLAADAAELRDLFAAVEALSLVASGLMRADVALESTVRH
jgi:hypothetical protein